MLTIPSSLTRVENQLKQRPTIKDVARAANVSNSTVSYILNNSPHAARISESTKQRVNLAVRKLGYKSNPIGRDLQRGYTNQVILLIATWNLATSHAATAMSISRAAIAQGLELTVHVADDDDEVNAFLKRRMLHNIGGMLVLWDSPAMQRSDLKQLAAEGVPVIDLLPDSPKGISTVTADREDAFFRGTQHLLGLGHRRIGVVCDSSTRAKTTIRKLTGYRRALKLAEIEDDPQLIENVTEFGFEGGYHGFPKLIQRCPDISSIICINDAMALGVIAAATESGRRCPEDISVVGFGDAPEGRYWKPRLTTVALSSQRVAEQSITLLISQRREPGQSAQTILIPEDLIVRDSTGPVPGSSRKAPHSTRRAA